MTAIHLFYALIGGLILGSLNSWHWYKKGYRGGRLFFLGTIAFFSIIVLILKLFVSNS